MKIVKYSDKRLHEVSKEVGFIQFLLLRRAMPELIKFMKDNDGIGLAGVQVGIMKRFFIMVKSGEVTIVYNPIIVKYSTCEQYIQEGCLSVPKQHFKTRSRDIDVMYQDSNFKQVKECLNSVNAIVFQHEYDHLNGKLIND